MYLVMRFSKRKKRLLRMQVSPVVKWQGKKWPPQSVSASFRDQMMGGQRRFVPALAGYVGIGLHSHGSPVWQRVALWLCQHFQLSSMTQWLPAGAHLPLCADTKTLSVLYTGIMHP